MKTEIESPVGGIARVELETRIAALLRKAPDVRLGPIFLPGLPEGSILVLVGTKPPRDELLS